MNRKGFIDLDEGCFFVCLILLVGAATFFIAFCSSPNAASDAIVGDKKLGMAVSKEELYTYAASHGIKYQRNIPHLSQ